MSEPDTLFLPGLVAPLIDSVLAPLPEGSAWWTLRARVAAAVRDVGKCLAQPPALYFSLGAQEALEHAIELAQALDQEWTSLYAQLATVAAPPVFALAPGQSAYMFTWMHVGPAFLVLPPPWRVDAAPEPPTPDIGSSVSLAYECVAVKYLCTLLPLYLAALHMSQDNAAAASQQIAVAIRFARDCGSHTLYLHTVSPARCDQIARAPLLLSPHFWRRWFSALLVAHAKHYERFAAADQSTAVLITAAFDSGHLLEATVGADAPRALCTTEQAAAVTVVGQARKAEALVRLALTLATAARAANESQNMAVAARLLFWYSAPANKIAATEAACLLAVLATTGQSSESVWGARSPPVRRLEFAAGEPRASLSAEGVLRVPLELYE